MEKVYSWEKYPQMNTCERLRYESEEPTDCDFTIEEEYEELLEKYN